MRIHFSHSVTDRGSQRSAAAISVIQATLPSSVVGDPNSREISIGHSRDHAAGGLGQQIFDGKWERFQRKR